MVPLWLAHVPLFLLTLFFAIAFSLSLWPSYDNYMQQRNRDDPITYAKNTEEDHKWMGQCYLDVSRTSSVFVTSFTVEFDDRSAKS